MSVVGVFIEGASGGRVRRPRQGRRAAQTEPAFRDANCFFYNQPIYLQHEAKSTFGFGDYLLFFRLGSIIFMPLLVRSEVYQTSHLKPSI